MADPELTNGGDGSLNDTGVLGTIGGYVTGFLSGLGNAGAAAGNATTGTFDAIAPDWLTDVGSEGKRLLGNPRNYIFARITEYILATIIGITLGIADAISRAFTSVVDAFRSAGNAVTTAFASPADLLLDGIRTVNQTIATTASEELGVAAPFVTVSLYVAELGLALRAAPAVLAALGEFAGSLPVIGDAINALITGALTFWEG